MEAPDKKKPIPPPKQAPVKHDAELNEIMRRLRVLEERYINLRKKSQLTDQNMLEDSKRIFDEVAAIQSIITELKKENSEVNSKMRLLSDEVKESVPKRELSVLSKYLEFWEPMDFVRKSEVRRIIEDALEEIKPKSI